MKDTITRILHWGFACLLLILLGVGFYMTRTEFSPFLYQMHKSLGVIFSLLMGVRLYWQIKHPWKLVALENKYELTIRNSTHWGLIILFFVMPVLGLMCSGFSGYGISLFNLEIVPENFDVNGEVKPFNEVLYKLGKFSHKLLAKVFALLIFLHIAGVFKHHFIHKDGVLNRMIRGK